MDILIETATGNEVQRWGGVARKVLIPGTNSYLGVYGDPPKRPMNIGSGHFLATVVDNTSPPYDSATYKLGSEVKDVTGRVVTLTRSVVALTVQELADKQQNTDIAELSMSVDKLAFIQTELIDKLLSQGTIKTSDFTPKVKAIFLDIKAIVDRAKPQ